MTTRFRPHPPPGTPGAEHHASATAPWTTPPPPLATGARVADRPGLCTACRRVIHPGGRIADLPGGEVVHITCAARA